MNKFLSRFGSDYFFKIPVQSKVIFVLLAFYLFVLAVSVVIFFYIRKKTKADSPIRGYGKKIFYTKMPIALLGLFFVFARYENLGSFSWRFWQYLVILAYIATDVWLFIEYKKLRADIAKHNTKLRKEKWLKNNKSYKTKHKN